MYLSVFWHGRIALLNATVETNKIKSNQSPTIVTYMSSLTCMLLAYIHVTIFHVFICIHVSRNVFHAFYIHEH